MARVIFKRQNPGAAEDGSVEVIAGARFIFKRRNPGAAEDGKVKVLIVARAIFQRRNQRPTHACRPPRCPWATREGRARHVKDAAQNDAGDVPQDAAQDLAFGADSRKAAGE